jgi:ribosome biogenesis GTPase
VIVANVDQALIVGSAAMPNLKAGLIDRLIVGAEAAGIRPIVCINKVDLVSAASLVPLAGVYARMGYPVILCSTVTGRGITRLQQALQGTVTAVVGQSGVGKSSILNAIAPELALPVGDVSRDNDKGRHTTTTARLIPHSRGGTFVDTPGVRQFQLWEILPAEVPSAFRDLRPLANHCRFPDCTHTHEADCAVKHAVADGLLTAQVTGAEYRDVAPVWRWALAPGTTELQTPAPYTCADAQVVAADERLGFVGGVGGGPGLGGAWDAGVGVGEGVIAMPGDFAGGDDAFAEEADFVVVPGEFGEEGGEGGGGLEVGEEGA